MPGEGEIVSAVGSMNHVAFSVPPERFDEYYAKLQSKGVEVSPVLHAPRGAIQRAASTSA